MAAHLPLIGVKSLRAFARIVPVNVLSRAEPRQGRQLRLPGGSGAGQDARGTRRGPCGAVLAARNVLHRPEVGLVQTPQHFRNPDPVPHNLLGGSAWTEEQHFFMTVVQSARESHGNAFCVGSGWVYPTAKRSRGGLFHPSLTLPARKKWRYCSRAITVKLPPPNGMAFPRAVAAIV
jgi:hypothetical protein